ncbi:MAG TPA: nucleoside triphosphate pyrophosphohydrolase family protein [Candidatus Limiplasma sp.]|nr:nucleoside triphosphate pyrophosphohydrolase family protein [Candidatus Limiplasma sp.]
MELNEYQTLAQRTSSHDLLSSKIENGVLGLNGESGECADLYKKYLYQGHEFDRDAMKDELGDVLWYVAELAAGLGITLEDVALGNIEKLRIRYPDGFDAERSMNREG